MQRIAGVLAVLVVSSGCAGRERPCPSAPVEAKGSVGERAFEPMTAEEKARWAEIKDKGPPAGTTVEQVLPEVEALLASPDPARRDGVAYELFAKWLMAEGTIDDAGAAALRERLVARNAAIDAAPESVFGRSFAALVLSVVAAREVQRGVWSAAELDAQIAAAAAYAVREPDLRGYTGETGWAHAAAHTADWLKFLARHPKLTAAQAVAILDVVATLVTRRHGARFTHGEDERMAAAARAVLRRGLVDDAAIDAWLGRVGEPLAAGWPDPFDPGLYAAQRNARDLLVSLFVALSFDDAPPAAGALARLRGFMMQ